MDTHGMYYRKSIVEAVQYDGTQDTLFRHKVNKGDISYIEVKSLGDDFFIYFKVGDWLYKENGIIKHPIGNEEFMKKFGMLPVVPMYVYEFIKNKRDSNREIGEEGIGDLANIFIDAKEYGYPNNKVAKYITNNPNTFVKACLFGCVVKNKKRR